MRAAVAREDDAEEGAEKKGGSGVVQSSGAAHTAACVALQRSPALPEFILTVGDWTFCIFKTGVKVTPPSSPPLSGPSSLTHAQHRFTHACASSLTHAQTPLFVSPYSQSRLTAGRWCPLPASSRLIPRYINREFLPFIAIRSPSRPSVILIAKADGSME